MTPFSFQHTINSNTYAHISLAVLLLEENIEYVHARLLCYFFFTIIVLKYYLIAKIIVYYGELLQRQPLTWKSTFGKITGLIIVHDSLALHAKYTCNYEQVFNNFAIVRRERYFQYRLNAID